MGPSRGEEFGGVPALRDVPALWEVAVEVATAAADLVRALAAGGVRVADTKSSAVDVVTEVDRRSEALVRQLLGERRPEDAVLGEEEGSSSGTSGVRWIVDPVDGTVNLLYGIAQFAVSLAAEMDGVTVAAAVVDVTAGTIWSAGLAHGAHKDGSPIQVRAVPTVSEALVLTGFGYRPEVRAHQGACVARILPRVRDIRRMGSCALDLCHLAEGLADAYVEDGPQLWDYAAARLVVTEAGGRFGLLPSPLTAQVPGWPADSLVVAAPAAGWDQFMTLLDECGFVG